MRSISPGRTNIALTRQSLSFSYGEGLERWEVVLLTVGLNDAKVILGCAVMNSNFFTKLSVCKCGHIFPGCARD